MHMLRIISGKYKSQKIEYPKKSPTRPVSQKVRGAIFSVLSDTLSGSRVLDIFAGSGALGIEAISRGAEEAIFVDKNSEACKTIQKNITDLKIEVPTKVIKKEAKSYLLLSQDKFDIIFLDPPYEDFNLHLVNSTINLLKSTGVMVVSCSSRSDTQGMDGSIQIIQHKTYGDTQILFCAHA